MNKSVLRATIAAVVLLAAGCMTYLTTNRGEVLLYGVDIEQTLEVAQIDLARGGTGSVLTIWAIRDQYFSAEQAARVSELYFAHVDSLAGDFDTWHLTWAIANIYRHGDPKVKQAIEQAYQDAVPRAARTHKLAISHTTGDTLYMGDAHVGGRHFAQGHIVVPGNSEYLQSADEYRRNKRED